MTASPATSPAWPPRTPTTPPDWTLGRLCAVLDRPCPADASPDLRLTAIATDTRALPRGALFLALRGTHFDGHAFLAAARDAGAAAVLVDRPAAGSGLGLPCVEVADTLAALGQLGAAWRAAWGGPTIAVGGANGKTSTKELLRAALGAQWSVHATTGNLNNLIGVPQTLLAIPGTAQAAIVEVGTSLPGEIPRLRALVQPDLAVVTSIGEEHLEGLGDLDGVLREEAALCDGAAWAVVPPDAPDLILEARQRARQVRVAGLDGGDLQPHAWGLDAEGRVWLELDGARATLPLRGRHQAANAMLALAVVRLLGLPVAPALAAMARMPVPAMRGAWQTLGRLRLLNDAYNANPPSVRAALDLLAGIAPASQRVAILGTMRELGSSAARLHQEVARHALATPLDLILATGEFAAAFARVAPDDPRLLLAEDPETGWERLHPRLRADAVLLLKASRGVRLERLVPAIDAWAQTHDTDH